MCTEFKEKYISKGLYSVYDRNEYRKKQSAAVLRLIEETNNNSVEIYNKILKMYDEKEKKIC